MSKNRGEESILDAVKTLEYDVVVIGGGPGGCGAAAAAGKRGVRILLVEQYGFLGGMATAGMVNPFMPYRLNKLSGPRITTEIFNEILRRLDEKGGLWKELGSPDEDKRVFDDELLKLILDEMMMQHRVDVLYHAFFSDIEYAEGTIHSAVLSTKSGIIRAKAKVFIDSTGDGDLAARTDAPIELGRPSDHLSQPMTLSLRIANVDVPEDREYEKENRSLLWEKGGLQDELNAVYKEAKRNGEIDIPREDLLIFYTGKPDVYHFNTTRVNRRIAADAFELSAAEKEGRRQAYQLLSVLKKHSPRFRNAYISKLGCHIGIRESRRVIGEYILDEKDVKSGSKFGDGVVRCNFGIDIHDPSGDIGRIGDFQGLQGDYYEIPLRCLIPKSVDNLLVGSRCISSTHEGHSSFRTMPTVCCIGEAAGITAALTVKSGSDVRFVDGRSVRGEIFSNSDI